MEEDYKPVRDDKGRWVKGNTGNLHPPGRPKGNLEFLARQHTSNGQELLDFWLLVMRSEEHKMDHRMKASENIATWGFAKPKDGTEHDISDRLFDVLSRIHNTKDAEGSVEGD